MKAQRGRSSLSLTSALHGLVSQRHAPVALPPGKTAGTHCIGSRAGLDGCGKSRSYRDSIPGPSTPQRVAVTTELSQPSKKCISHIMKTMAIPLNPSALNLVYTVITKPHPTWSLTLEEERRLRMFKNRVLRGIYGSKRDEVKRTCRKPHNEELIDLYSSPNIVRVIKWRRMRWA